uniref:Uncharacterized protein n=1 Tax=Marseillevirus LCMAC101 TaxID=2506602 RepID=A0A481YS32_9VIRU|nr:MAG: hypothetical protein LCMAC101_04440 [Marseillevirus LCMAC101]
MDIQRVFVLVPDSPVWEDLSIFLCESEAIEASKKYPKMTVEIFEQKVKPGPFVPTYDFYRNGIFDDYLD